MPKVFKIDGKTFSADSLSAEGQTYLTLFSFCDFRLKEVQNMKAVTNRTRNEYMDQLKKEVLRGKSGLDLDALLSSN